MPYISTDRVKEIRNELKTTFPQFKFSVKRYHYSVVVVTIRKGPIDFGNTEFMVSPHWLENRWKEKNLQAYEFFDKVVKIVNHGNCTVVEDGDYGSIPRFYIDINVGDWQRPYEVTG